MYKLDQSFYSSGIWFAPHNKEMQMLKLEKQKEISFAGKALPGGNGAAFGAVPTGKGSVLFQMHAPENCKVEVAGMNGTSIQKMGIGKVPLQETEPGFYQTEVHGWPCGFMYIEFFVNDIPTLNDHAPIGVGYGRLCNFCEVPGDEDEMDIYRLKDVPHGTIHNEIYYSTVTEMWRNCLVYTPPQYDPVHKKYPTLYLQHGGGENETGWVWQGKINYIMDNMLFEGKCVEMIVVMNAGYSFKADEPYNFAPGDLGKVLRDDCIPMIESKYSVYTDREHRAMAGLSMGSFQTQLAVAAYPELFAYEGIMSGSAVKHFPQTDTDTIFADPDRIREMKLIHISWGTGETKHYDQVPFIEELQAVGHDNIVTYTWPGVHEWRVWRRAAYDFAQHLFRD